MEEDNKFPWGKALTCLAAALLIKGCEAYNCTPIRAQQVKDSKGIECLIVETRKGERIYLQDTHRGYYLNKDSRFEWYKLEKERKSQVERED